MIGLVANQQDKSQGPKYDSDSQNRLVGRTVIVTGANSGIGKATATQIAKRGGRLIMACRDMKSAYEVRDEIIEETYNRNIEVMELNLASLKSIAHFSRNILKNESRLDILVNNAGVMSSKRKLTQDGFEEHLGVNFIGPYLLTRLLLPKLQESQYGRIINVTTRSQEKGQINFEDLNSSKSYHWSDAYKQSKLAVMLFTQELAQKYTGIRSYAVDPGVTQTRLARSMQNSAMSRNVVGGPMSILMRTPENAAQTVVYCCVEPSIADESGKCYKDLKEMKVRLHKDSISNSQRLWLIAEKWSRFQEYVKYVSQEADR